MFGALEEKEARGSLFFLSGGERGTGPLLYLSERERLGALCSRYLKEREREREARGSLFVLAEGKRHGALYSLYLKEREARGFIFSLSKGERGPDPLYFLYREERE